MFEWLRRAQFTGIGATPPPPSNPLLVNHLQERDSLGLDKINEDLDPNVDNNWHGYVFKEHSGCQEAIYIGRLPYRTQFCMYVEKRTPWLDKDGNKQFGVSIQPLAYFKTEKAAREALKWLDRLGQSYVRTSWPERSDEECV